MAKPITYVGLDVHKDTIAVALAEAGLRGKVREHGRARNRVTSLATSQYLMARQRGPSDTQCKSAELH